MRIQKLKDIPLLSPLKREYRFRTEKGAPLSEMDSITRQWDKILQESDPRLKKPHEQPTARVLFVTGYGFSPAMLSLESVLMMALHIRGCSIDALYCNRTLPSCEFNATGNGVPHAGRYAPGLSAAAVLRQCNDCVGNIEAIFPMLPVSIHGYDRFVEPEDRRLAEAAVVGVEFERFRDFEFEGIKVGEEAFASVLRVTLCGTVEDTAKNRWLVGRYLHSCVLMVIASRNAFSALKPDRIVANHGVYVTHGIATKVANQMGIPIIIYGIPYRQNTLWFSHGDSYHRTLMTESHSSWADHDLTAAQKQIAWDYLISRQAGGRDYVNYHPNPVEDVEALYRDLRIDRSRQIISLFTNVIWDAQIYYNFNVFKDIFEWVSITIQELAKNDKVWLVIRVHPAEVKGGMPTMQPILPEIRKLFPILPDNVRIIPPESDLSSYTLAECSRAAIIYGTKMGLEMAARGLPVIVCGETFNRGKGFTIDIETVSQYVGILEKIHEIEPLDPSKRIKAIQYTHYLFFRKMIEFPFVSFVDPLFSKGILFQFEELGELVAGKNHFLDLIMEGILDLKPLHLPAHTI